MGDGQRVVIELFGVPRLRAGVGEVVVSARTVREALHGLERACPGLAGLVDAGGRLARQYLLSIDGREFVADFDRTMGEGERLVLLTADAGG
jgi:sulfur-carrier protein